MLSNQRSWIQAALALAVASTLLGCDGSFFRNKIDEALGKKQVAEPTAPVQPPAPPAPPTAPAVPTEPSQPTAPLNPTTPLGTETTLNTTTPTAPAVPGTPPVAPGDVPTDQKLAEMDLYVQCLNRAVPRSNDSYRRYLSWVNEKTGPTCKEPYVSYALYTLYDDAVKKCKDAAAQGAAGGPSWPKIEKSMGDVATAFAQLVPLTQQAYDYYNQQDYKDDNCAKGQALHPQLMDAFGRLRTAAAVVDAELKPIKEELDAAELLRVEQSAGKKLEWQTRSLGIAARQLVNTIPEDNAAAFQPSAYLAAYAKLEEAYNSFNTYVTANPTDSEGVFWFSAYQSSAKEFFTKAKFLKRDLAEGKKADGRSLQDLIEQYNRFIGDSNSLRFSR